MSVKAIYDSAPLGALIRFSNGELRPPARFTRKVAAWERVNGVGRDSSANRRRSSAALIPVWRPSPCTRTISPRRRRSRRPPDA
jgi:hypothetical protein